MCLGHANVSISLAAGHAGKEVKHGFGPCAAGARMRAKLEDNAAASAAAGGETAAEVAP